MKFYNEDYSKHSVDQNTVKTLIHAHNLIEAQLVKNLLASESIDCVVLGEFLQGAIGELPANDLIRVAVEDEVYERALRLVEGYFKSSPL
jgi:hypothetical protein